MSSPRLARIEELFEEVLDQPRSEQLRVLQTACRDDESLITDVLLLLDADAAEGHRALSHGLTTLAGQLLQHEAGAVPHRFGRYTILEPLGQGGMGGVYLAAREGLDDRVAVKFLQNAWNSPERRNRFASEQRMLACLNHPFIARLYDAGVENGTPWFAMEFVKGMPVTEYCRNHRLGLRDRLKLFRDACEAIRYAHRILTVHLDLKPSNILVTEEGAVKLLDFGIARRLNHEGRETEKTQTGMRMFSLNYASPEQIRGDVLDIQTDVHGLGVVLYELLTGKTPADLSNASASELIRYTEEPVQRPSETARGNGADALIVSRADWADLDVLCATSLHRDRTRRYQTVDALIRDLDHFLKQEPLEARTDNVGYRLGKFVARNRWPVIAAGATLLTLLVLSLGFTARLVAAKNRALASEARTRQTQQLMMNLFGAEDETAGPAKGLHVTDMLGRGVQQADALNGQPELQAQLRYTLGGLFHRLGKLDQAEVLLRSALTQQTRSLGIDDANTVKTRLELANLHKEQGRLAEAEREGREILARQQLKHRSDSVEVAEAQAALGSILTVKGDFSHAVPLLQSAEKIFEKGGPSTDLSFVLTDLSKALYEHGDVDASEPIRKRLLELDRHLYGPRHPNVAIDLHDLALSETEHGNYIAAESMLRQALDIDLAWYGETHRLTGESLSGLALSLVEQKRYEEAAVFFNRALAAFKASDGERSEWYGITLSLMGDLARARRQLDKAEQLYTRSAEIMREVVGEKNQFYAVQLSSIGAVCVLKRDYGRAEQILRRALSILQSALPPERYTALTQLRLAAALTGEKKFGEAEKVGLAGYATLQAKVGPGTSEIQSARNILRNLYIAMNEPAKADRFR